VQCCHYVCLCCTLETRNCINLMSYFFVLCFMYFLYFSVSLYASVYLLCVIWAMLPEINWIDWTELRILVTTLILICLLNYRIRGCCCHWTVGTFSTSRRGPVRWSTSWTCGNLAVAPKIRRRPWRTCCRVSAPCRVLTRRRCLIVTCNSGNDSARSARCTPNAHARTHGRPCPDSTWVVASRHDVLVPHDEETSSSSYSFKKWLVNRKHHTT